MKKQKIRPAEMTEKYNEFFDVLKKVIRETEKRIENINQMSEEVELYSELTEKMDQLHYMINRLTNAEKNIPESYMSVKEAIYNVKDLEEKLATLVIHQEEKIREKTESVFEKARKIV